MRFTNEMRKKGQLAAIQFVKRIQNKIVQAHSAWPPLCGYTGAMSTGDGFGHN